jgi:hypothetical protein
MRGKLLISTLLLSIALALAWRMLDGTEREEAEPTETKSLPIVSPHEASMTQGTVKQPDGGSESQLLKQSGYSDPARRAQAADLDRGPAREKIEQIGAADVEPIESTIASTSVTTVS